MSGEHLLIVGAGVTGQSVAAARGHRRVTLADDRVRQRPGSLDTDVEFVAGVADWAELVAAHELVVVSPGVTPAHPVFSAAVQQSVELIGEIEFALRTWEQRFAMDRSDMKLVAVTGTNGKTTVTTLIGDMLASSGLDARTAGNIGTTLVDVVRDSATTVETIIVAEVSSFQLATTQRMAPRAAVVTNIADDHYDWHREFSDYAAAKSKIVLGQMDDDLVVYPADERVVLDMVQASPAQKFGFSRRGGDVVGGPALGLEWVDSQLLLAGQHVMDVDVIDRQTPIDRVNLIAAGTAALHVGATAEGICETAASFSGLAHRTALVADVDEVAWIDDSKATNPHAAVSAISNFESVVLIAGGRNKGLDLGAFAEQADRIKAMIGIGEAATEVQAIAASLGKPSRIATSMDDAVRAASEFANPGDTVLLSPACASFDWYRSYAERGNDFERAVQNWLLNPARDAAGNGTFVEER